MQNRIDDYKEQQKNAIAKIAENVAEWQRCVNVVFSSPEGQYFAKYLIKYINIHGWGDCKNPNQLLEDNGKRRVYLELIRPYLDETTRKAIE